MATIKDLEQRVTDAAAKIKAAEEAGDTPAPPEKNITHSLDAIDGGTSGGGK